jgi:hypothetical protein
MRSGTALWRPRDVLFECEALRSAIGAIGERMSPDDRGSIAAGPAKQMTRAQAEHETIETE